MSGLGLPIRFFRPVTIIICVVWQSASPSQPVASSHSFLSQRALLWKRFAILGAGMKTRDTMTIMSAGARIETRSRFKSETVSALKGYDMERSRIEKGW